MAEKFAYEIVAPDRLLKQDMAETVLLPGDEGDFAVMAEHAPFMTTLRPGAIEIYEGEKLVESFEIGGGFAEVANNRLIVLTEERSVPDPASEPV